MTTARTDDLQVTTVPLLRAKFSVPKARGLVVPRRRLFDELSDGVESTSVTYVSGPAGWGKTQLVASWIGQELPTGRVTWLSLDPGDDQRGAFWSCVVEALRTHGADLPPVLDRALRPDDVNPGFLSALGAAISAGPETVVLVLDQFEVITDPRILRDLNHLLRYAAEDLRLVVTSRRSTLGGFSAHLLTHDATHIDAHTLGFTLTETEALLVQHGLALAPATVEALHRHTEGWAAALRLCALAMESQPDPARFVEALPGQMGDLADYLLEEVVEAQALLVRRFLLQTGIVDRLTPDLAGALTGRADADQVVHQLVGDHLLVEVLDAPPGTYRYHPLLALVLRAELARTGATALATQHRRAATWFDSVADHGQAAVHHAAARDWEAACTSVVRGLGLVLLLEGRAPAGLQRALTTLPPWARGPAVDLVRAALALRERRLDAAQAHLAQAAASLHDHQPGDRAALLVGVSLVTAVVARRLLDVSAASTACTTLERQLLRLPAVGLPVAQTQALALTSLAGTRLWTGDVVGAADALRAATSASKTPGCEHSRVAVLGQRALLAQLTGRLRKAERLADASLQLAGEVGGPAPYPTGTAHLALSLVALERADVSTARAQLAAPELTAEAQADPALWAVVGMLRAVHLALAGDLAEALGVLAEVRGRVGRLPFQTWMTSRAATVEAALRLRSGDVPGADAALALVTDRDQDSLLTTATVRYAQGDVRAAAELLTAMTGGGRATSGILLEARLLNAQIAWHRGDAPTARAEVLAALRQGLPESHRRPFLEHRTWLTRLTADDPQLTAASAWLGDGLPPTPGGLFDTTPIPVEPLTPREHDVLLLMAAALSVSDIAGELQLSVNTIKSHQKTLYQKFSVHRAADAVRRGRALQLI